MSCLYSQWQAHCGFVHVAVLWIGLSASEDSNRVSHTSDRQECQEIGDGIFTSLWEASGVLLLLELVRRSRIAAGNYLEPLLTSLYLHQEKLAVKQTLFFQRLCRYVTSKQPHIVAFASGRIMCSKSFLVHKGLGMEWVFLCEFKEQTLYGY